MLDPSSRAPSALEHERARLIREQAARCKRIRAMVAAESERSTIANARLVAELNGLCAVLDQLTALGIDVKALASGGYEGLGPAEVARD